MNDQITQGSEWPAPHSLPEILADPARVRRLKRMTLTCAVTLGIGLFLILCGAGANGHGMSAGPGQDSTPGAPWIGLGITMVLIALGIPLFLLLRSLVLHGAEQGRRYRAWKKTLTPQERAVVSAGELAALMVAQHEVHKWVVAGRPKAAAVQQSIMQGGSYKKYLDDPFRAPGQ
jgi:hypothetical protein